RLDRARRGIMLERDLDRRAIAQPVLREHRFPNPEDVIAGVTGDAVLVSLSAERHLHRRARLAERRLDVERHLDPTLVDHRRELVLHRADTCTAITSAT